MNYTIKTINKALYAQNVAISNSPVSTKLYSAYIMNNKKFDLVREAHITQELQNKKLDLCLTGSNGEVLLDKDGGYLFDKKGLKELKRFDEELSKKEVEFNFTRISFSNLSQTEKEFITSKDILDGVEIFKIHEHITKDEYEILSLFISDLPEIKAEESN